LAEFSREAIRFGLGRLVLYAALTASTAAFAQQPLTPAVPPPGGLLPPNPAPAPPPAGLLPPNPAPAPPPGIPAVLRVGILAADNVDYRLRQAEPFRAYLEARLGTRVEIVPERDYATLIDAQITARVQYAIYSGSAFATAEAMCSCVEPIAVPAHADGAVGFYSILLSRADSPIATLDDARGLRLALVAGDSIAGRLVPVDSLKDAGTLPDQFFAAVSDMPSPQAAVAALLAGEADVAVAWSSLTGDPQTGFNRGVLAKMVGEGALAMDQIRIIWQSELIPYGPHAVRSDVSQELKAALLAALTSVSAADPAAVDAIDRSGVTGFVAADPAIYDPLRRLVDVESPPAAPP
jgi:phosphonate transport system substrate-binding protein